MVYPFLIAAQVKSATANRVMIEQKEAGKNDRHRIHYNRNIITDLEKIFWHC